MAVTGTGRRKNAGNGDVQARLSSVRNDLDALHQDVRGLVSDVGDAAGDQVHEVVNAAKDSASNAVGRVSEWGNENLNGVRQAVRTQPLAACVLSISAGAILGALLLR